MQNYHKHTSFSNVFTPDSAAMYEDYAKRAVELGHKVLSCVEHGWQSNYYAAYDVAKEYDLKFIFGAEAYWVRDRFEKDRGNHHIIILAKNENGRQAINDILAEANISGYYFKPRVDLELLLSLPADDVFITTACVAFWNDKDPESVVKLLHEHFKDNFMLEIQYHDTDKQIRLNKKILKLSKELGIKMIVGLDSHYILQEDKAQRDYVLAAKDIHYDDEDGWYMDYPSDEEVMSRFLAQNIFTKEQVQEAMDNTNILLTFEDFKFSKDIKLPTLYPDKTMDERKKIYRKLITRHFKSYTKGMSEEEYKQYFDGVLNEIRVYENTGMVDYPLLDYAIVQKALEMGGLITDSGRGSAVGFFTNTLCGFSKVDRFKSPIKLYPERFISESRILETRSLPDIDINVGTPEIFEKAQQMIMGEEHVVPMIAFGTFKKKSAFKLYARAKNLPFDIATRVSEQIGKYDEALKHAEDDERDEINIYDFVEEEYHDYVTQSQPYWGIISDKKKAPCAYLLYQGNIRKEIGLIKCKTESSKKEYITTVIDGGVAEKYKFLKNDILKVDVVLLIDKIFKRIGIEHFDVSELTRLVENDEKVWDLYAKGYTIGLNQCEKESTTRKVMRYQPRNISELSAFIAAIRPSFKSMYSKFESREPFDYGIPVFDKIIQTEQFPYSYILYQEQLMNTLNYAGFPLDQCYGIIKAIAKKHPEKVRPLKAKFLDGFKAKLLEDSSSTEEDAETMSQEVWRIIDNACGYGFNSAHAYCMALDSLYCAWQKANYPHEFYEVMLQHYSDKGNKDKVALIKQEMLKAYGITEGEYRFGLDNRKFIADVDKNLIYPSLVSIKGISQDVANDIYDISKEREYLDFYEVFKAIRMSKTINSAKFNILVDIGYFDFYGKTKKIRTFLEYANTLYERSQFTKGKIEKKFIPIVKRYSKETEKKYCMFDYDSALKEVWETLSNDDISLKEKLRIESEYFGYVKTVVKNIPYDYCFVQSYECKFKNPILTLYRICNGDISRVKVKRANYDACPIKENDIIKIVDIKNEGRWSIDGEDEDGKPIWKQSKTNKEQILRKWNMVK